MNIEPVKDFTQATVDTLTSSYSDKWAGAGNAEQSSTFIQFMSSHELIFVVLGVSLIIWFVLLFFIIRVDRKVSKLEKTADEQSK
jgi:hypothetical protein